MINLLGVGVPNVFRAPQISFLELKSKFSVFLLLSIAYAASIGGMATLVGSPPNTQMASILEQNYNITISFFDWMKIGIPLSLTLLLAVFVYFYFEYFISCLNNYLPFILTIPISKQE